MDLAQYLEQISKQVFDYKKKEEEGEEEEEKGSDEGKGR